MAKVRVSAEINAPVEAVFNRFTDIGYGAARVGGIKKIEVLTPGGFHLGTRWNETRNVLGRDDDAEMEVTAFEKDQAYTITHHKAGVRIDTTFTFAPNDAGTTVGVEFALNSHGLPPGLLTPLEWAIAGKVRDVLSRDLSDLKLSLERIARN